MKLYHESSCKKSGRFGKQSSLEKVPLKKHRQHSDVLLYGFLTKTPQGLKIHHIKVIETDESEVIQHHKSFSNHICVDLICLCFANVSFPHLTGFDGVQHTHIW